MHDDGAIDGDGGATAAGVESTHLVSVAGHDAQHLQTVMDAGMLFVPNVDGVTHAEGEFAEFEDCLVGACAFLHATLELATVASGRALGVPAPNPHNSDFVRLRPADEGAVPRIRAVCGRVAIYMCFAPNSAV